MKSQMQHHPMVDLKGQYEKISGEIDAAILEVVKSTSYIGGPYVSKFKESLAQYLDVPYVIPCANGTDALQIAMMALDLKPGDEVITTSFTYVATVEVLLLLGLKPILVDVDPVTFNMDPQRLAEAITPNTKAIVPVHLFGQGADMDAIMAMAKEHNIRVVEDTAQALGALHKGSTNQMLGTIGDFGTTSFFPSKNLGAYGDGGALFTRDKDLADKALKIANHGQVKRYYHSHVGVNSRLDAIQAAVLSVKLRYLDDYNAARQKAAKRYNELLTGIPGLETPVEASHSEHIYHQYTLKLTTGQREAFQKQLNDTGVATTIYYPLAAHHQEAYKEKITHGPLPVTEEICGQVISLPMHTELTEENQNYIAGQVKQFFSSHNTLST